VQPLFCEVRRVTSPLRQPGRKWFDIKAAASAAVPAPVRTLLLDADR